MAASVRESQTLTLVLEIHGEHAEVALERAERLVATTQRLLPNRLEIGVELGEDNIVGFYGDETSLRLLHALGVKRGVTPDFDSFEELAGLESEPQTGGATSHRA